MSTVFLSTYLPAEPVLGNKFSTTWRPVGDYIHLKVVFTLQPNALQVARSWTDLALSGGSLFMIVTIALCTLHACHHYSRSSVPHSTLSSSVEPCQVSGSSYILWAAENYQGECQHPFVAYHYSKSSPAFNKLADELAAKEAEEALQAI